MGLEKEQKTRRNSSEFLRKIISFFSREALILLVKLLGLVSKSSAFFFVETPTRAYQVLVNVFLRVPPRPYIGYSACGYE